MSCICLKTSVRNAKCCLCCSDNLGKVADVESGVDEACQCLGTVWSNEDVELFWIGVTVIFTIVGLIADIFVTVIVVQELDFESTAGYKAGVIIFVIIAIIGDVIVIACTLADFKCKKKEHCDWWANWVDSLFVFIKDIPMFLLAAAAVPSSFAGGFKRSDLAWVFVSLVTTDIGIGIKVGRIGQEIDKWKEPCSFVLLLVFAGVICLGVEVAFADLFSATKPSGKLNDFCVKKVGCDVFRVFTHVLMVALCCLSAMVGQFLQRKDDEDWARESEIAV